eukprot:TRINITY_DN16023_c0_g2_i1.p1 TRINITY_DN16023_c0_g2~~TRINITY_DN16023_c0_g2_i1.p1  ORF type:complete len:119 (+),score=18.56 TRINITY_DN16023_c0_g2_i1:57-413(+)
MAQRKTRLLLCILLSVCTLLSPRLFVQVSHRDFSKKSESIGLLAGAMSSLLASLPAAAATDNGDTSNTYVWKNLGVVVALGLCASVARDVKMITGGEESERMKVLRKEYEEDLQRRQR